MEVPSLHASPFHSLPQASRVRWPRLVARAATLLWAGWWTWFVVVDGLSDATKLGPTTYLYMAGFLIAFWVPTWLAWRRPAAGSIALALVGIAAFVFFDYPGVRWILAAPPLVLAVAHGVIAWRLRRGASADRTARALERGERHE